jgi:hypothetical protein
MRHLMEWLAASAGAYLAGVLASPLLIVAHVAALAAFACMLAGALVRTMMPLRWLAVASGCGLLAYGVLAPSATTADAAAILLPVNIYRAVEVTRLTRRVHRAGAAADLVGHWLKPHMKVRKLREGRVLFNKGDAAHHLFMLADGEMELVESGMPMEPGRIFGEIALFSPSGLRTQTARCRTACTVLQIHESTVMQLYYQHPSFGFHLIGLLAARLSADVERMERGNAADAAGKDPKPLLD